MTRVALLMAGGAGTRLWPLSSDQTPKQFLRLFDGQSLLRRTWERVRDLDVFVSTNERYTEQVRAELPEVPPERILTEPARRNTAPALALCCGEIASARGDDVTIACLPADHFMESPERFRLVLDRAFEHAEQHDALVTIAIQPTEANTGYGYLELGGEAAPGVLTVRRFVEKPDRAGAEAFLRAGNYAWNSGMFVWRAAVFREELSRAAPELANVTRERYLEAPSVSIDHGLMEKAARVAAVPGDFGWSDVGNWSAVARFAGRGETRLTQESSADVFAVSYSGKPVVVVGVSNIAVIESPEGILVLDLDRPELLANAVRRLDES